MKISFERYRNALPVTPLVEVIRDSSIYGATRIISVLIGVVTIPIFALIMPPEVFGMYSLALLTVTISYQVVNEWSRSSILRFDSKYSGTADYKEYLSNVFIPPIAFGIIVSFIVLLFWFSSDFLNKFNDYIPVAIAVFLLSILHSLLITLLRIRQRAKQFSIIQLANRIGALVIGIGLIVLFGFGGEGLLYGMLASYLVLIPISLKWTRLLHDISVKALNINEIKRYLSYGIPLTLFALFAFLMRYTDRYMISIYRGIDEVGLYSFACLLPQRTIEMIIGIVALGAYPIIVREWENTSKQAATVVTSDLARYHMLITFPIMIILVILPREVISLAGTQQYIVAFKSIPFVSIATYFTSMAWFSSIAFHFSTHTRQLLNVSVVSLIFNILLNLIMVPKWGYNGAALSTMITSIIYFIIVFSISRKWLPWKIPVAVISNVLASTLIASVIAILCRSLLFQGNLRFFVSILMYVLIYVLMLEILGEFKITKVLRRFRNLGDS